MGQFSPKSKAIHLVFCPNLAQNQFNWFSMQIQKWPKWANFRPKVRLYTWYFAQFWPKINFTDFEWRLKSGQNGQFSPKSKAIHLVFCPILAQNQFYWFWVEIEKWPKWANFCPKVRLYTWYFAQFWPKINFTNFEWRLKSGQNGPIFAQK